MYFEEKMTIGLRVLEVVCYFILLYEIGKYALDMITLNEFIVVVVVSVVIWIVSELSARKLEMRY